MNLDMFTNLNGRIGRQSWWIGTIIILIAAIILYFILGSLMGVSIFGTDPAKMLEPGFMEGYMKSAAWIGLIMTAIIFWPTTALMSQRLNDRDRPSWLKWLFWVPSILSTLLGVAGMSYTMSDIGGVAMPTPTTLSYLTSVASFILGVWALIEMGILRGTDGANQHGTDPV